MSQYNFFVMPTYLKNNLPVIDYVEDTDLKKFIKIAMDVHMKRVMGYNLFTDIQSKCDPNTLNADETFLMNTYIQPATMWCFLYEYTLFSHYKYTNKGITKQNSDNSVSADLGEVNYMMNRAKIEAQNYKDELSKYLIVNSALFPAFYAGPTDLSKNPPTFLNSSITGIYTGRRRGFNNTGFNNGQGYGSYGSYGCNDCPGQPGPFDNYDLR